MSQQPDVNATFASLGGLVLLGSVSTFIFTGNANVFYTLVLLYVMLVTTNAIRRGELRRKK